MPSVRMSTSQRCAIAARTMRSRRVVRSVVMRGTRFFEVGLDDVALLDDDFFAGSQALEHLGVLDIALAEPNASRRIGLAVSHEHDRGVFHALQRLRGNDECR